MLKSAKVQSHKIKVKPETPFVAALRKLYRVNDYIILEQIPIHQEGKSRVADALVIGRWASRDPLIHGFEIKTGRQDWLNELKNPEKADAASIYCDTWSVYSYPNIVDTHEVPPLWGHLVLDGHALLRKKEPSRLTPKPVDRTFLFKVLDEMQAQASNNVELVASPAEYQRGFEEGKVAGVRMAESASGFIEHRLLQQLKEIDSLKANLRALGISAKSESEISDIRQVAEFCRHWNVVQRQYALKTIDFLMSNTPEGVFRSFSDVQKKIDKLHSDFTAGMDSLKNALFSKIT
jgi:hypothetical protein